MMLKKKRARYGVALASATALCLGFGVLPAHADPVATPPATGTLVGTGSDTIQDVFNGLAAAIGGGVIASFDATNPVTGIAEGTIVTRTGLQAIDRPDGSGDGVKLLSYAVDGLTTPWGKTKVAFPGGPELYPAPAIDPEGYVDFARSSSGPASTTDKTRALSYISFAKDAVTFAVNGASDFPRTLQVGGSSDSPSKVTLYNIYNCRNSANGGLYTYSDRDFNTITINPLVPQGGSGTRKYWSEKLAADGNKDGIFPACVTDRNNAVQEHNGNALTGPGDIVPYSIAQYIAQGNHSAIASVDVTERRGLAVLGTIGSTKPLAFSGSTAVMNPDFAFTRYVYVVVPTSRLDVADASAAAVATRSTFLGNSSAVCQQSAVIQQFGFATIGSQCGVVQGSSAFTS